ncbi:MAG TPA: acylphosphatase [bacterium]|jgi:acylphosphatase|nr:acylphosphatase [Myxococcales bacterium]OQA60331.1 MAG: Acylphosphatase [bacterium ADurb.Bin270]HPW45287.1 acylphosphatase [bacterium]HQC50697.1 acylphosphatase [bacterium]HQG13124.1 acylphosphatase [bacterium]
MKRIKIRVGGRVQGVFYRANTEKEAKALGLTGFVRNLPDGGVEITAEGKKESLEKLARWCQKGPPAAKVDKFDLSWEEPAGEFSAFQIRY